MQLLVWLLETRTGDLDEIRQKQRYAAYFDEIKHDGRLSRHSLFMTVTSGKEAIRRLRTAV